MKEVVVHQGKELIDYIGSLWVSDEFKKAHKKKDHFLWDIITQACEYPIFFVELTQPIERSHFTTYFRHVFIREYHNPIINDLYYLHELAHMSFMYYEDFQEETSFDKWAKAMAKNEFEASMVSEVFVYLQYPSLRTKTFPQEIWVDRFLKKGATNTPEWILKTCNARKKVLTKDKPNDSIEAYIHDYAKQNEEWALIWKNNFAYVNRHLTLFKTLWPTCNTKVRKYVCINMLRYFVRGNTCGEFVPFYNEAKQFHDLINHKVKTDFRMVKRKS